MQVVPDSMAVDGCCCVELKRRDCYLMIMEIEKNTKCDLNRCSEQVSSDLTLILRDWALI